MKGRLHYLSSTKTNSEHLDAFHVNGITLHVPGYCNVMPFVSFERIPVFYRQHFVVAISDDHGGSSTLNALFGAGRSAGVGALGPALGIADPSVHRRGFAHIVGYDHGH